MANIMKMMDFYTLLKLFETMKEKSTRKREGFEGQQLIVIPKKNFSDFLTKDLFAKQVYITDIGFYPKARYHYAERLSGISQNIIIYCVEGSGWIELNKKKVTVSASQIIFIPAHVPHRYAADEKTPWTIYWVHFKGELADHLMKMILKNSSEHIQSLTYSEKRIETFREIYRNLETSFSNDTLGYVNMVFFYFLSSLIYPEKFNFQYQKPDTDAVSRAIGKMQQNISATITLNELADSVNLSVSHFCERFRIKTGFSPVEYFNHLKMQKACQYLSFTKMPIKEIALNLGVTDPYYFSRMFSRSMGMSPMKYRKKM